MQDRNVLDELKDKIESNSLGMEYSFVPNNPYTIETYGHYGESLKGFQGYATEAEKAGVLSTAGAEFREMSGLYHFARGATEKLQPQSTELDPFFKALDPSYESNEVAAGWNPKSDPSKFLNIDDKYQTYLLDAKTPKDLELRHAAVLARQADEVTLANGSFIGKLLGGGLGLVSDPANLVPFGIWAKYGKASLGAINAVKATFPGIAASSAVHTLEMHADKINDNLQSFISDYFVDTIFASALFGVAGAAGPLIERMHLWDMRKFSRGHLDGVDFKFEMNDKSQITGIKAVDSTGSLSAAQVSYWQEMADSSFHKGGLFKIPYVGQGILHFLSMPILGTPLPKLLNSTSLVVRSIADRFADHSIITKGQAEGKAAPVKFKFLTDKDKARLTDLHAQFGALHLERNGGKSIARPLNGIQNLGLGLYNKGLKELAGDLDKTGWVSKDTFYDEVQTVIRTETPSVHESVNAAAKLSRDHIDEVLDRYLKAYNLPKDWIHTRTARAYLMRVYDTAYLQSHQTEWIGVISNWLKESDELIAQRMEPLNQLKTEIEEFSKRHAKAFEELGIRELQLHPSRDILYPEEQGVSIREFIQPTKKAGKKRIEGNRETKLIPYEDIREEYNGMRQKLKAMEDTLQDELRSNPLLDLHVEDRHALSATEAKELEALLKPINEAKNAINEQKQIITKLNAAKSNKLAQAKKSKTVEKAKPRAQKYIEKKEEIDQAEDKLHELESRLFEIENELQERAHKGEINPRFYTREKDSFNYQFKNPNDRLRFRDQYNSHFEREAHAKAYYTTILHQNPEDTINQVMGRLNGNERENPLKARTLLLPDEILYSNNFMTKDLMAKIANYTNYLGRRTALKTVYQDVSIDGGMEPMLVHLTDELNMKRAPLTNALDDVREKLKAPNVTDAEKKQLSKQEKKLEKQIAKTSKDFELHKKQINFMYEKMMGIQKTSRRAQQVQRGVMAGTAAASLQNLVIAQINDLGAIILQNGLLPFIHSGVYPVVQSLAGLIKTKDSEALRKTAPAVLLGLQDQLLAFSERNMSSMANPYLNMGKVVGSIEKIAHASSLLNLSTLADNGLQHLSAAVAQHNLIDNLIAYKKGKISQRDLSYLRKYGIDPAKWADRMVAAYNKDGGGKTTLGGRQSLFWQWQDLEASNEFSDAVFRAVKDTNIQASVLDSPMWMDPNSSLGIMGPLIKGFKGWMYASVNRYLIPAMQQPDAQALSGIIFMLGTGALISPVRRLIRGEDAYPDGMTDSQWAYEVLSDSGIASYLTEFLNDVNVLTSNTLLEKYKNDRYKDRTRVGLIGPAFGKANMMIDVIGAVGSGEWNKSDARKASRFIPGLSAPYMQYLTKDFIEKWNIPETRSQAHALKEL